MKNGVVDLLTRKPKFFLFLCGLLLAATMICADDNEAGAAFDAGLRANEAGDHIAAAKEFAKAGLLADAPDLKLRAFLREADSYQAAGYRGKEFDVLEKVINQYPTKIEFGKLVDREFDIGDAYYAGYSDPAFWSLRFIPWLTDKSRMPEVYEAALKHAPFSKRGGDARLRLAVYYLKKNDNDKALKLLREVIQYYPESDACRYAFLELGNALFEMSKNGDGDSRYFEDAMAVFNEFREKYPKLSENEWINRCIVAAEDVCAERLYGIAHYYSRNGKNAPAEIYLLEVLRKFPNSTAAPKSEALLTEIDKSYFPERIEPEIADRYPKYEAFPIPPEQHRLILAPENSNNRFLLPIYDLNLHKDKVKP